MSHFWAGWTLRQGGGAGLPDAIIPNEPEQFTTTSSWLLREFWSDRREKHFKSGVYIMGNYAGVTVKKVSEKYLVFHDFSPDFEPEEVITVVDSISISNLSGGSAAGVLTDHLQFTGNKVSYGIKGGVNGVDYKVTLKVATNQSVGSVDGGTREVSHLIQVRNI